MSTPAQVRRLLTRAGIDDVDPAAPQEAVVAAVARVLLEGRTVTVPLRPGARVARVLGAGALGVVIVVAVVLARVFDRPWMAAICAAGVGPFMLFHLVAALPGSGGLWLDRQGVWMRHAFRERAWNWSEIDRFSGAVTGDDGPGVGFTSTRPEDTTTDLLDKLRVRGLTLTTRMPDSYGLGPRSLAVLLQECRTACAPCTAGAPPREIGSAATARLLNACGGAAVLLAFSWFAVLWVAPGDPIPVLVICALMAAGFGALYGTVQARRSGARSRPALPGPSEEPYPRHERDRRAVAAASGVDQGTVARVLCAVDAFGHAGAGEADVEAVSRRRPDIAPEVIRQILDARAALPDNEEP
ncbi:MAG: hypothetical protein L0I76_12755 [Pseudonocardia sp.]|nr:hypothetical protein [Pseudonocardia sp.]